MNEQQDSRPTGAVWMAMWLIAVLVVAAVLRHGTETGAMRWAPALALGGGALAALLTFLVTLATERAKALIHRVAAVVVCSGWMALVSYSGWSATRVVVIVGWAVAVAVLEWLFAPTITVGQTLTTGQQVHLPQVYGQEQTPYMLAWQAMLRRITGAEITVRGVVPWDNPNDGEQIMLDLPEKMTVKKLADYADDIAGGAKLPQGCIVRVLDAAHQGAAILDVMKRDCLADTRMLAEPTTAASINDELDIATSPRGEAMTVCLRQKGMVVGGTTGSGKTTFLHRIIMFLARCTDTLIWIIDFNGGGLASLWLGPYARGEVDTPTIDWLAEDEAEAAVMGAIAIAVGKDRKTNRESMRRKRAANSTVVPVDKDFPAVVIITDEGGEVRQAVGLLARLVDQYVSRVAQIARAEGIRVIQSVLRGTADLLSKELRVVQGIRVCLRMDEEGEYDHVLGKNPGRVRLLHIGSVFVYRTDRDYRPILARTVDVDIKSIEAHAVATAHLRPKLDDRAKLIASRVTVEDVLDGRDPNNPDLVEVLRHPAFVDVAAGVAYENRWKRKAAMLAQLRDEDPPEDDEPTGGQPATPPRPRVATPGSALDKLMHGAGVKVDEQPTEPNGEPVTVPQQPAAPQQDVADVDAVAAALLSDEHMAVDAEPVRPRVDPPATPASSTALLPAVPHQRALTARERIRQVLDAERPDMLTATEVHTRINAIGEEVSKQRTHELLNTLVGAGEVLKDETRAGGPFYGLAD